MRISDWSSDVCSSDLQQLALFAIRHRFAGFRIGQLYLEPLVDQHTRCASGTRGIRRRHENVRDFGLPNAVDKLRHAKPLGELGPSSEERRVGKECDSTCRSRWWPKH